MNLTAPCRQATRLIIITPAPPACKYRRRNNTGRWTQRPTVQAFGRWTQACLTRLALGDEPRGHDHPEAPHLEPSSPRTRPVGTHPERGGSVCASAHPGFGMRLTRRARINMRCGGSGERAVYAAYGARQFIQDLTTGGRDVRSHRRRPPGPAVTSESGTPRRVGGEHRPSRRRASGHVDRQHHAEWRGTSGRTLAEPIWRQARAAGIAASAPPSSYSVAPWRVDTRARGHWPGLRRVAW